MTSEVWLNDFLDGRSEKNNYEKDQDYIQSSQRKDNIAEIKFQQKFQTCSNFFLIFNQIQKKTFVIALAFILLFIGSAFANTAIDFNLTMGIGKETSTDIFLPIKSAIEINSQKNSTTYFLASTINILQDTFQDYTQWLNLKIERTKQVWLEVETTVEIEE